MMFGKSGAIAGAIALAVAWPFAIGQIGQTTIERELDNLPESTNWLVDTVSYQRGYLSSEMITRVSLIGEMKTEFASNGLPTSFDLLSHLDHGLLGISGLSSIQMTPELKKWTEILWTSDISPLSIKTYFSVLGSVKFDAILAAIDRKRDDSSLTSSPLYFTGEVDKSGNTHYKISIPLVDAVNKHGETLFVKDFISTGNGKMQDHFWIGQQDILVATVGVDDANGRKMTINNFAIEVNNNLKNQQENINSVASAAPLLLDNSSVFSFQQLTVSNEFVLNNFTVGLHLSGIDYASLVVLLQALTAFGESATTNALSTLIQALDSVVNKGLDVNINPIAVSTPQGPVNANLHVGVAAGIFDVNQNINALTAGLQGNVFVDVPSVYLRNVPAISAALDNFARYGFVSETENRVTLTMKIEHDHALSPNGKKVPISTLIMDMM